MGFVTHSIHPGTNNKDSFCYNNADNNQVETSGQYHDERNLTLSGRSLPVGDMSRMPSARNRINNNPRVSRSREDAKVTGSRSISNYSRSMSTDYFSQSKPGKSEDLLSKSLNVKAMQTLKGSSKLFDHFVNKKHIYNEKTPKQSEFQMLPLKPFVEQGIPQKDTIIEEHYSSKEMNISEKVNCFVPLLVLRPFHQFLTACPLLDLF